MKKRSSSSRSKSKRNLTRTGSRSIAANSSGDLHQINQHAAGIDIGAERH